MKVKTRQPQPATETPQPAGNCPEQQALVRQDASDLRKEEPMSRLNAIFVALGSLAIVAVPLASSHAQTPASLEDAAAICRDYGVRPGNPAYDTCVNRAAWAYDSGQPGLATLEAQRVSDA